jgi:YgiT-type zinc finger domain-containing protein
MHKLVVTTCPSCGSKRIKRVRRNATRKFEDHEYTVPNLEYYECPECGEKVYDRDAMRQIEAHSPAFERLRSKRKTVRAARSATPLKD